MIPAAASASSAARVPRMPQRRLAAAVDQLVRLGEELDLADAAAAALEVEARPDSSRRSVVVERMRAVSRPISSIAPKSRLLRQTNGRIAARNASPAAMSPAQARARMKAARSQASAELS